MNFQEAMEEKGIKKIKGYKSYQQWQCSRKRSFRTEAAATHHIRYLRGKFKAYRCEICGEFHLTGIK